MIILNINDPEIEKELTKFSGIKKQHLEKIASDAIRQFINSFNISYKKKDVTKHSHIILKDFDADQTDDIALDHIQNSDVYIHNLRRK